MALAVRCGSRALAAGAVIITTPQAIKSLMLKFVENLTILTDEASKAETFDDEVKTMINTAIEQGVFVDVFNKEKVTAEVSDAARGRMCC